MESLHMSSSLLFFILVVARRAHMSHERKGCYKYLLATRYCMLWAHMLCKFTPFAWDVLILKMCVCNQRYCSYSSDNSGVFVRGVLYTSRWGGKLSAENLSGILFFIFFLRAIVGRMKYWYNWQFRLMWVKRNIYIRINRISWAYIPSQIFENLAAMI